MRALFVVNAPVFGGGHNQIAVLREPLERLGWETLALVPDEPGNAAERLAALGVEVLSMPMHRIRATPDPRPQARFLTGLRREVQDLRGLIRRRGIDLVQAHGVTHLHSPVAAHLERSAVVWELYDTRAPMFLRRIGMPLVTRTADVITSWGRELARVHPGAQSLGDRTIPVFPPVDARRFRPDPEARARARRTLNVTDRDVVVGSVGNLNPQKGHEYLVEAAAIVRRTNPDVRVRIIGAPGDVHAGYAEDLRVRARALGLSDGTLEFVGPVDDATTVFPGFDVLAVTSVPRSEGMPTVILEAMACEKPVVSTNVGAIRELVRDGVTGAVVEPLDPSKIAVALSKMIADPAARESMGKAARADVMADYELERCAERRARAFEVALLHRKQRYAA